LRATTDISRIRSIIRDCSRTYGSERRRLRWRWREAEREGEREERKLGGEGRKPNREVLKVGEDMALV